jgi:hypothetical protein
VSDVWTAVGATAAVVAAAVLIWGAWQSRPAARDARRVQRVEARAEARDAIHASLVRMSQITTLIGHEGWLEWKHLRDGLPALISETGAQLPITSEVAELRPELAGDGKDRPGDRRALILWAITEVEAAMSSER